MASARVTALTQSAFGLHYRCSEGSSGKGAETPPGQSAPRRPFEPDPGHAGEGTDHSLQTHVRSLTPTGVRTMNVHDRDIATPKVTTGPIAGSRKTYVVPDAAPDLRVPVREVVLTEAAAEPPVPVYDPSGPYTDAQAVIDVEAGLARSRIEWVR